MSDQVSIDQAQELTTRLAELVRDASVDSALMARLMADWREVLTERDIRIPGEVELVFLPNRKNLWFLPVPFASVPTS